MPDILIYTSTICPYCTMAKSLLQKKGVTYKELNIDTQPELRTEMMQRTKRRTVPQIFIGNNHVGGFDELYALERKNQLDELLAPA